jgi:hypothetical protein
MQVSKAQEKVHVKRANANARAAELSAVLKNTAFASGVETLLKLEVSY